MQGFDERRGDPTAPLLTTFLSPNTEFSLSAIICYWQIPIGDCQSLRIHRIADRKSSKPKKPKTARWQRLAMMDKEILDVEGAATLLGVSTTTIYI